MNLQKSIEYFKSISSIRGIALVSPKHKIVHHNLPLSDSEINVVLKQIHTVIKNYPKNERASATMSLTVGTKNVFYNPVPSGAFLFLLENEDEIQAIQAKCLRIAEKTYASPPKFKKEPLQQSTSRDVPLTTLGIPPQKPAVPNPTLNIATPNPVQPAPAKPAVPQPAAKAAPVLTASGRLVVGKSKEAVPEEAPAQEAAPVVPAQPDPTPPDVSEAATAHGKAPAAMTQEAMQPVKPVMTPVLKRAAMAPTTKIQVTSTAEDKSKVVYTEVYADNKQTLILGLEDGFDIVSAHNTDDGRVLIQLKKTLSAE